MLPEVAETWSMGITTSGWRLSSPEALPPQNPNTPLQRVQCQNELSLLLLPATASFLQAIFILKFLDSIR